MARSCGRASRSIYKLRLIYYRFSKEAKALKQDHKSVCEGLENEKWAFKNQLHENKLLKENHKNEVKAWAEEKRKLLSSINLKDQRIKELEEGLAIVKDSDPTKQRKKCRLSQDSGLGDENCQK